MKTMKTLHFPSSFPLFIKGKTYLSFTWQTIHLFILFLARGNMLILKLLLSYPTKKITMRHLYVERGDVGELETLLKL